MPADLAPSPDPTDDRRRGLRAFALAISPALLAIWAVPWFVTQDGPTHLYNAQVIAGSLTPDSPFREVYEVRWEPLPNWAGHLALVGLLGVLPPRAADRMIMTITFVGFAASVGWLRWRVAGWRGMPLVAPLAAMLGLNMAWLLGFTSFLLGACLFPITLGVWWAGRERMGPGRAVALACLLVLGYFCHLVSLGLTALGLVVLAATTPGPGRWRRRTWTALCLAVPLIPLGVVYRGLMHAGGPMAPVWENLKDPRSWASWSAQLGWVDPLSLGSKAILPFVDLRSRWCGLLAPVLWTSLGLLTLLAATLIRPDGRGGPDDRRRALRGWGVLAALLLLGGVVGPDSFGANHGNFLPQRAILLGLAALVPFLDLDPGRWPVRAGGLALAVALAMQSAFVWDYALYADRTAGAVAQAGRFVGRGRRVGVLLIDIRGLYRSNPLLHSDCALGIGTGNVVWGNYETNYYYFPVRLRDPGRHPSAREFELVAINDRPEERAGRARRWEALLDRFHDQIDALVVWGTDPRLDALNARWFEPRVAFGKVRVFGHRAPAPPVSRLTRDGEGPEGSSGPPR